MFSLKNKKLWFFTVILLLGTLLGIRFLNNSAAPYHLALVVPSSGQNESYGDIIEYTVTMYLDEVNSVGGIAGRPVALKMFDEPTDPSEAARLAREIVRDESILLVLGHRYSSTSLAVGPIYQAAKLPVITATASDNAVTEGNPWFFRVGPNNHFEGVFTAHYLHRVFPGKTVGVIYSADAFGVSLFERFKQAADELGMELSYQRMIDHREEDVDKKLVALAADFNTRAQPDILYLATQVPESVRLLTLIQSANNELTRVCSYSCASSQFLELMKGYPRERSQPGYYSDNVHVMSPFILDIANQQAQYLYRQLLPVLSPGDSITAAASYYDTAQLAISALKTLKPAGIAPRNTTAAREQIRRALAGLYNNDRSLSGVTGRLYFDSEGNVNAPLSMGIYQQQQLISAPVQYRQGEDKHDLPVGELLDDLWSGEVMLIGDALMRRTRVVYTGITVNEIKEIDTAASTYELDFYLWFRFYGEFADKDIRFENADEPVLLGEPILDTAYKGMTARAYRVQGVFKNDFYFADYPFDRQYLAVRFRHRTAKAHELLYVNDTPGEDTAQKSDENGPAPKAAAQEWMVQKTLSFQDQVMHQSSLGLTDQSQRLFFSRFNSLIEIERDGWSVLFKNLFPIMLLAMLAYLAYFMSPSKDSARISLGSSALLTTAFFHLKLISTISVDYVMLIEFCFFSVYLLAGMVIFVSMINAFYFSKADKIPEEPTPEESAMKQHYRRRMYYWDLFGKIFHPTMIILMLVLISRYG